MRAEVRSVYPTAGGTMLPITVSAETVHDSVHGKGVHVFGFQSEAVDRLMSDKIALSLQIADFELPDEAVHVSVIGRPGRTASVNYAAWNGVPRPEDRNLEFPIALSVLAQTGQIPRGSVCCDDCFVGPIDIAIFPAALDAAYHAAPDSYNQAHLVKPYGCEAIVAAFRGHSEAVHSVVSLGSAGYDCPLSYAIASIPGYAEALANEWLVRESVMPDRHDVRHLFEAGGTSSFLRVIEEKRMFAEQFLDDPSWIDDVHPAEIDMGGMFEEWVAEHESDGVFVGVDIKEAPSRVASEARGAARLAGESRADQAKGIGR